MEVIATTPSMAAVAPGMAAVPAILSVGKAVLYPRSNSRFMSGSKLGAFASKLRGSKGRQVRIVRSTVQLEGDGGSAAGAGGDSAVSEVAVLEQELKTPGVSSEAGAGGDSVVSEGVVREEEPETPEVSSAAGAGGDSVVSEVALLDEEPETPGISSAVTSKRKSGPLGKGGTLSGAEALGKDPGKAKGSASSSTGSFEDPRWAKGTWDLTKFTNDGKVNWDSVIDAEVKRRTWLEANPEGSTNDEPVVFESGVIPWWAWVKRFHLPEAELLNGRAAMVGYFAAYLVDSATGVGLVDQQSSFFGKLLLFIVVVGVLLIRKTEDVQTLKGLAKESTFYDKQWQATWKEDTTKEEKP